MTPRSDLKMNSSLLRRALATVLIASAFLCIAPSTSFAQDATEDGSDAEARANFEAGRVAYDNARYEDALQYFRRAHELSGRAQLLYNIGQTLDRLRRDAEAVEAFEAFLEGAPETSKRREVEARIGILRQRLNTQPTVETTPTETTPTETTPVVPTPEQVAITEPQQTPEPEAEEASGGIKPWVWAVIAGVVVIGAGVGIGIAVSGGDSVQGGSLGTVEL